MIIELEEADNFFDESAAMAHLLHEEVVIMLPKELKNGDKTTVLYVNCGDVFAWGCSDLEPIKSNDYAPGGEIEQLYKLWKENNKWGPTKWVCLKRNMRPQSPIIRDMKQDNYWDEQLEKLGENPFNGLCK